MQSVRTSSTKFSKGKGASAPSLVPITFRTIPVINNTDPWSTLDGRLNAPLISSGPQHPRALDINSPGTNQFGVTYTIRPPWKVAGVDYPVGIPDASFPLKDPMPSPGVLDSGLTALGCLPGGGNTFITSPNANSVIDGYDFGLHGGLSLFIDHNDITVQNCKFTVGTNGRPCIMGTGGTVTNFTLQYCVIDGAGVDNENPNGALIQSIDPSNQYVMKYNWIKNAWYQLVQTGPPVGTSATFVAKYNLFETAGVGRITNPAVHGDYIQFFGDLTAGRVLASIDFEYNFNLQNLTGADTQGHSLFYSGGSAAYTPLVNIKNNVHIGRTNFNYFYTCGGNVQTMNATSNYYDISAHTETATWMQYDNLDTGHYGPNGLILTDTSSLSLFDGSTVPS